MRINIAIIMITLGISGCASLPGIKSFSADTITLADSIDQLAQDTSASCLRRLALDVPIKDLSTETTRAYNDVCDQSKQSSDLFIALNGTTRAYGRVLGQLADNQLVSFDAEVAASKDAITTLNSHSNNTLFNSAQLNALSALSNLLLHAATDAYRQRQIQQVLDHHGDLIQLTSILQTYINRVYLPALENESDNLDSLKDILIDRHLKSEPLRSKELLEFIEQQKTAITERKNMTKVILNAITKMLAVHAALLKDHQNNELLKQLLQDYSRQILDVRKQIHSAF